jgi:hypothetical protein
MRVVTFFEAQYSCGLRGAEDGAHFNAFCKNRKNAPRAPPSLSVAALLPPKCPINLTLSKKRHRQNYKRKTPARRANTTLPI